MNPTDALRRSALPGATPLRSAASLRAAAAPGRREAAQSARSKTTVARSRRRREKPLDKRDVMMIVTQLSIMTRSGVEVADALRSLADRAAKPAVRESLRQLHVSVEEGNLLSQAFAAQRDRFGDILVATVAAGEASGQLPDVLTRLRTLLRDELRTRSAIRSVLSYPTVLAIVTCGVLFAMVFFVLPKFAGIYAASRAPVPWVTQLLLAGGTALRTYWWAAAAAAGLAAVGVWRAMRSPRGRAWLDRAAYRLPLVRDVTRALGTGRLFRLQGILLEAGIPLLEVLHLTENISRNSLMKSLNSDMQEAVLVGQPMSSAFAESECLPDGAMEMVATGEANGQLGDVLQTVGEFFESEGEQKLKDTVKVAEPAIIVALGVVVGSIVLAVMLPMLNLSSVGGR
ncbi:MAG: hypothetical protein CMJ58_22810 [Planctomycetaceae bacterium]|nr:hypothetical protein [Planctomycetaceae bacterium]